MRRMGRTGKKIKLCGLLGVVAGERHRLGAHRQVNAVEPFEYEDFSIRDNLARSADVDRAQFTALEEECAPCLFVVRQLNGLVNRHHATNDEPVEISEVAGDL